MTVELTAPAAPPQDPQPPTSPAPADTSRPPVGTGEHQPLGVLATSAAALLSTTAAAWMAGGLFRGGLARPAAVLGAVIGVGLIAVSYRTRHTTFVQYLVLPVAVAAGAALAFTAASAASLADVPPLVADALRTGGLGQPPVPFDAGWRFIVVVVFAVVGAAGTSLALGLGRANVGVFLPVPALIAAGLVQPDEAALTAGVVALLLLVAALAVAYGAELARDDATSAPFEVRRLARATVILGVLAASLVTLNGADFLFPEPARTLVTPPKRPEASALATDQVLFTVASDQLGPWRLGVLDVYDDGALLLPPFDRERLAQVRPDGDVPGVPARRPTTAARFTLTGVQGFEIPNVAGTQHVEADGFEVAYDPRTQLLRLQDARASEGMTYTVQAGVPPSDDQLAQAPPAPQALDPFTAAPPAPPEVTDLLAQAPRGGAFERLGFVRAALHREVVTAGLGQPVEVPPARVVEMLQGDEATPYEITTAEVLLARWAGVPARLGYGYLGGEREGDTLEVRPRQAATWLEAYFEGWGWVPFTDAPPRAQANLSEGQRQSSTGVRTADQLALTLYVPIELQTIQHLYEIMRYWLLVALPFVVAAVVLWRVFPTLLKGVRRLVRQRWAGAGGPRARLALAYAHFRDAARDLNIGDARATPLEFLDAVDPDDEHSELAWLVTRALWGDLGRDLRAEDADAAEELARSVTRRLRRAQPLAARTLALTSTASLRDPFSPELPNVWPRRPSGARLAAAAVLVVPLLLAGPLALAAADRTGGEAGADGELPERLAPERLGPFTLQREESAEADFDEAGVSSLVTEGRVFSVRRDGEVQGYLQVAALAARASEQADEVREGVLDELATGHFEPVRRGSERIWVTSLQEQTFQVWFAPDGGFFQVFVARESFGDAQQVFDAILAFQRGRDDSAELRSPSTPPDPRRGGDYF